MQQALTQSALVRLNNFLSLPSPTRLQFQQGLIGEKDYCATHEDGKGQSLYDAKHQLPFLHSAPNSVWCFAQLLQTLKLDLSVPAQLRNVAPLDRHRIVVRDPNRAKSRRHCSWSAGRQVVPSHACTSLEAVWPGVWQMGATCGPIILYSIHRRFHGQKMRQPADE